MEARADVLFYVQHLLGIGHLNRAAVIARALSGAGLETVLITGGMPVANLETGTAKVVQLPPARVLDEGFALVDDRGQPVSESWRETRRARLLRLYRETRPRVVLIELFPFGRRQMRFELLPLLDAAQAERPAVKVVCSLRDVLSRPARPEKAAWMLDTFERYFDAAIVHGDPAFLPLDRSFPDAAQIAEKLVYSGYVTAEDRSPDPGGDDRAGSGEVIVSTGGGAVAMPLVTAALRARPRTALSQATWRLLIGQNLPEEHFRHLRSHAAEGVVVERARPDFRNLLKHCALSISQAGYNTVMDVLSSGAPAVVVPFAGGTETEQSLRAAALAKRGWLTVVEERGLSGESLARGVAAALARGRPVLGGALNRHGARTTARYLAELIAEGPS